MDMSSLLTINQFMWRNYTRNCKGVLVYHKADIHAAFTTSAWVRECLSKLKHCTTRATVSLYWSLVQTNKKKPHKANTIPSSILSPDNCSGIEKQAKTRWWWYFLNLWSNCLFFDQQWIFLAGRWLDSAPQKHRGWNLINIQQKAGACSCLL